MNFNPIALQLWFSVHMCWIQGIVFVIIWKFKPERTPFTWRWSMPWVSFFLLLADAAYFHALVDPDAKIGLLSGVRRGSLLITFTIGWLWFKEANIAKRWAPVCGLVLGLALISWASH
jgi:hypothetical protein